VTHSRIVLDESAMRNDGTVFTDHDVHRMLRLKVNDESRSLDFKMRPEQESAVEKTAAYFASWRKENGDRHKPPHLFNLPRVS
jgi:hypothetical protein